MGNRSDDSNHKFCPIPRHGTGCSLLQPASLAKRMARGWLARSIQR
eukprot:CAMPEP_0174367522 /NCGR_PEP_ID=MMETSP0811_2-20130205/85654_1 /TAXON_ID=73025 ORGANISM="Eutreptiella gymnastica-like, Strain CCMP1594" /NCGR_SAMPLE_ID=MMETSP0811_2 /ASSEMBLY_ACC=CAM_ASM_000667 /LENGTH=45 /DNA_ID= /DNA_START= /DNA_END= /DNA_ORIENTATION=